MDTLFPLFIVLEKYPFDLLLNNISSGYKMLLVCDIPGSYYDLNEILYSMNIKYSLPLRILCHFTDICFLNNLHVYKIIIKMINGINR